MTAPTFTDSPNVVIGPFVVGERPAQLLYTFEDQNGAPINISGYAVKLNVREQDGPVSTYDGTLVDAVHGQVGYAWTGAEFPGPGSYDVEFWIGNGGQRFCSIVIKFAVRVPIGPVPNI